MGNNMAQIVKIINDIHFVSDNEKIYECKTNGKLKYQGVAPQVGDFVEFDKQNKIITKIYPRKNSLLRPNVSNIDQALIVTSLKDPNFSTNLLDKLLLICHVNNIKPVICITKKDLVSKNEIKEYKKILNYYKKIGYKVIYNTNKFKLKHIFKNKTTVFTGQTGAGKSSLINKLNKDFNFETGETSKALGRGKHTTRYVTLVNLYKGKVLDTPGFSNIDLKQLTDEEIKESFIEFNKINCEYKDCKHINEKNCRIKEAVKENTILKSRYENYLKFIEKR